VLQQIVQLPFVRIALPIVVAITIAAWNNNKRIEDLKDAMNHRFEEMIGDSSQLTKN